MKAESIEVLIVVNCILITSRDIALLLADFTLNFEDTRNARLSPETKLPFIGALQKVHKYLKSERDSMYSVCKPIKTLLISQDYVKQKKKFSVI